MRVGCISPHLRRRR